MVPKSDYTEALQTELLCEMAGSFFGERCAVEKQIEALQAKEAGLIDLLHDAQCALQRLEALLGRQLLRQLFDELGCEVNERLYNETPEAERTVSIGHVCEVDTAGLIMVRLARALPLRWLKEKAFAAVVCRAWKQYAATCERYMDGPELTVAEHGVKGRGLGYEGYIQRVEEVNRRVRAANVNHAPSCVIGLMESLDAEGQRQQNAAGAVRQGYVSSLDDSLCMVEMVAASQLIAMPVVRADAVTLHKLKQYAARAFTKVLATGV